MIEQINQKTKLGCILGSKTTKVIRIQEPGVRRMYNNYKYSYYIQLRLFWILNSGF